MSTERKYLFIKNDIKEKIETGMYSLGTKIPSENKLTKLHAVTRHTVRQAISDLVNEGYLLKKQGSGTFVRDKYLRIEKKTGRKTIGVITTYISDYIFPYIIRGIEEELSNRNYSLMLSSTRNNVEIESISLKSMIDQNVDGLIVEPTKSNLMNPNLNYYLNISEKEIPLIMINATYEELDLPFIAINDIKAGKIATEHLIELGHTRIGLLTKADDVQGKNRMKGYLEALNDAKLTFESNHVFKYNTETKSDIPMYLKSLIESEDYPTAFVVYNDEVAMMLIYEIHTAGLNCPEDISVVSHDDSHYSTTLPTVQLTTIRHPKEELGRAAVRWLVNAIETNNMDQDSIVFEPKLIVRNSTRRIVD